MIEDRNTIIIGRRMTSGYWVTSNEMGNESACGKGLIFATGLRHNLRQNHDSTCGTPFGRVNEEMVLSGFPACRGPQAL